jgi:hypothetical protein
LRHAVSSLLTTLSFLSVGQLQNVAQKKLTKFNRNPKLKVHKLENLTAAFEYARTSPAHSRFPHSPHPPVP